MTTISVFGAGAWGGALAFTAARAGHKTILWDNEESRAIQLRKKREIFDRLPGIPLPQDMVITSDPTEACAADIILLVMPAQVMRQALQFFRPHLRPESYFVICSKGIEISSGSLMTEVVRDVLPEHGLSVLSGPNFATEVAQGLPAASTLASEDLSTARMLASTLSHPGFRIYPCEDVTGVALAGALKNVIAIAAGIATAAGLGENARAALITQGLNEMTRFGLSRGAREETFLSMAGMGDLLLTCASSLSRNFSFGLDIGRTGEVSLSANAPLVEGYYTAKIVCSLAAKANVDMPVCETVYRILYDAAPPEEAMRELMAHPLNRERPNGLLAG
ncbi:MAG: NAD(P)H-dependent glycerol-3-phosphate dehydrogenase [Holosporales bacterium]